jgi:hypothetical protein
MPRAQTGITPLPPENALLLSFKVEDLPLKAMSIGHIAANVPGLVNEIKASAGNSDLLYSIGFGSMLWNFIWQGNMAPGFRPLEFDEEKAELIDDDDEEEEMSSGSDLTFCFFSSDTDLLHYLAEESQTHLKSLALVNIMVLANRVQSPEGNSPVDIEKVTASVLIDKKFPEFSESSFLFTLGLAPSSKANSKLSKADQEIFNQNLANGFNSLVGEESGLIHHLYSSQTENQHGHYMLALSNRVDPFQNILSSIQSPAAGSKILHDLEITPTLHFLPSLEILAALRMGALRMGPLSPTAKWK